MLEYWSERPPLAIGVRGAISGKQRATYVAIHLFLRVWNESLARRLTGKRIQGLTKITILSQVLHKIMQSFIIIRARSVTRIGFRFLSGFDFASLAKSIQFLVGLKTAAERARRTLKSTFIQWSMLSSVLANKKIILLPPLFCVPRIFFFWDVLKLVLAKYKLR